MTHYQLNPSSSIIPLSSIPARSSIRITITDNLPFHESPGLGWDRVETMPHAFIHVDLSNHFIRSNYSIPPLLNWVVRRLRAPVICFVGDGGGKRGGRGGGLHDNNNSFSTLTVQSFATFTPYGFPREKINPYWHCDGCLS